MHQASHIDGQLDGPRKSAAPHTVDLGRADTSCSACENSSGNRLLAVPGEPVRNGERGATFVYAECGRCASLDIVEGPEDLASFYEGGYYSFAGGRASGLHNAVKRLRDGYEISGEGFVGGMLARTWPNPSLQSLRPLLGGVFGAAIGRASRILDVGCGAGAWLKVLREQGFHRLTGVDPFLESEHRDDSLRLFRGEIEDVEGEFDLISSTHALEHMEDPESALIAMKRRLAPEGVIMISIPLADSYAWRRYGGEWVQLDAPRHAHLYSVAGFRALARRAGLCVAHVQFNSREIMVLGSEMRLVGLGPHQREEKIGGYKAALATFDKAARRAASSIAKLTNTLGTADQATFFCRAELRPEGTKEG